MGSRIFDKLKRSILKRYDRLKRVEDIISNAYELMLADRTTELVASHKNPLNRYGKKCFSQADEDGITVEILRRIGCLESGVFAEYGVGDGTENNTLLLKAIGWRGVWIGGDELSVGVKDSGANLIYLREWVTLENLTDLLSKGMELIGAKSPDVLSFDLDGNDYYFVDKLLKTGVHPKLFIVEYNAKFIPPIKWKIDYDPQHRWSGDDYMGASLCSFVELFTDHGYTLVCCNASTGTNAFFVKNECMVHFSDVPTSIYDIYSAPRYFLSGRFGHRASVKSLDVVIRQ